MPSIGKVMFLGWRTIFWLEGDVNRIATAVHPRLWLAVWFDCYVVIFTIVDNNTHFPEKKCSGLACQHSSAGLEEGSSGKQIAKRFQWKPHIVICHVVFHLVYVAVIHSNNTWIITVSHQLFADQYYGSSADHNQSARIRMRWRFVCAQRTHMHWLSVPKWVWPVVCAYVHVYTWILFAMAAKWSSSSSSKSKKRH